MAVKFANNAYTTLSSGINDSVTTIPVADILKFPNITGADDYMYVTIVGSSSTEIIKVTNSTVNTFTCLREQDNSVADSFDSGDRVELRVTAAMLNDLSGDGEHASKGLAIAMSVAL